MPGRFYWAFSRTLGELEKPTTVFDKSSVKKSLVYVRTQIEKTFRLFKTHSVKGFH